MEINLKIENLGAVREVLDKLSGDEARGAYAKAINDTAFKVRRAMQLEIKTVFDRPKSYVVNSPRVVMATPDKLSAGVAPTDTSEGRGINPQKILQAQEFGGVRRHKRIEVILLRAGILPAGMQTALPRQPFPGSDDGHGNFRASFIVKLLSFLQAFGEHGYKSNITDKSARRRKDVQSFSVLATRRQVRLLNGWEFFISLGKGSIKSGRQNFGGGHKRVFEHARRQNLAAGIWARQGGRLCMVMVFTALGGYQPRLSMERVAESVNVQDYLDKRVRFRIREAAGV